MAEIKKVGVLGAGLMGHGIAQVDGARPATTSCCARSTTPRSPRASGRSRSSSPARSRRARATQEDADAVRGRIKGTTDYNDLADCDLVIEAITESLPLKLEMWKEVDRIVKPEAIFATNTSLAGRHRPGRGDDAPDAVPRPALLQPRAGHEARARSSAR